MNNFNENITYGTLSQSEVAAISRRFLLHVYNWMAMGLAITGLIAYGIGTTNVVSYISGGLMLFIIIAQLLVVILLSALLNKISSTVAIGAFFLYSILTGITFSLLFLVYIDVSIYSTFLICAGMFAAVSVFGYTTKINLSGIGTFLLMGLVGLIIASVVNIFIANDTLNLVISYAGVLIFTGLTAFDTQRIKRYSMGLDIDSEYGKKVAIMGALNLYLDFINLFLFLLRIMGDRR